MIIAVAVVERVGDRRVWRLPEGKGFHVQIMTGLRNFLLSVMRFGGVFSAAVGFLAGAARGRKPSIWGVFRQLCWGQFRFAPRPPSTRTKRRPGPRAKEEADEELARVGFTIGGMLACCRSAVVISSYRRRGLMDQNWRDELGDRGQNHCLT